VPRLLMGTTTVMQDDRIAAMQRMRGALGSRPIGGQTSGVSLGFYCHWPLGCVEARGGSDASWKLTLWMAMEPSMEFPWVGENEVGIRRW
jgi:hypothetical protein